MIWGVAPTLALLATAAFAALEPGEAGVDGVWRTEPREGGSYITVRIGPCDHDAALRCGTIEGVHGGARPELVGEPILRDLERAGPGEWHRGEIIRPGKGTVYRSEMTVEGDALEVRGCALGGLLCGGQTWRRVR